MNKKPAFTLIELLVVIAVIGILAGVLIGILNPGYLQGRARNAARKADLGAIQSALEMYYSDLSTYPGVGGVPFGSAWTGYMNLVPQDPQYPKAGQIYTYTPTCVGASCSSYSLCATLEPSGSYCVQNPF